MNFKQIMLSTTKQDGLNDMQTPSELGQAGAEPTVNPAAASVLDTPAPEEEKTAEPTIPGEKSIPEPSILELAPTPDGNQPAPSEPADQPPLQPDVTPSEEEPPVPETSQPEAEAAPDEAPTEEPQA